MEEDTHICPLSSSVAKEYVQINEMKGPEYLMMEDANDESKIKTSPELECCKTIISSIVETDNISDKSQNIVEDTDSRNDSVFTKPEFSDDLIVFDNKEEVEMSPDPTKNTNSTCCDTVTTPSLVFENIKMLTGAWSEFCPKKSQFGEEPVFLKGCKWSPDGTCLLTNSDDATMRLFDLPLELYNCQCLPHLEFAELKPSLRTKIGGLVYDYCWYPLMTSMNPDTCCFLTTSSHSPVQLWDAFTGSLRCSYRGYNNQDEMHAALSVAFHPLGDMVLCGYKDSVKIFHTDVPGRDYTILSTKGLCDQKGLVSCIAVNPSMPNIFAAGNYSKTVGLYTVDGHGMCLLEGQSSGLTQLLFTADGSRLFSAGRKDSELLCWDLRQLGQVLSVMRRPHTTNQRVYMDLSSDDRFLLSGSTDGHVYVWDLLSTPVSSPSENSVVQPLTCWQAHNDCVNGLSVHRHIPVVATASGQRYIPEVMEGDDEDCVFATERPKDRCEESVRLWWTGSVKEPEEATEEMRDAKSEQL